MVNKKAVFIVAIVALIIVGLIFGIEVKKLNSDNPDVEDISEETNQNTSIEVSKENTIDGSDEETDTKTNKTESKDENKSEANENENNVSNNATTDSKEDDEEKNTTNTTNTSEDKSSSSKKSKTKQNPEDVAISLARKKWGNSGQSVYFDVEEKMSNGVYLVSVRDENTTAEIVSYKVDVNKKTVSEN